MKKSSLSYRIKLSSIFYHFYVLLSAPVENVKQKEERRAFEEILKLQSFRIGGPFFKKI